MKLYVIYLPNRWKTLFFYMEKLSNEYNFLILYRSNNLKRLGINWDGGYIVDGFLLKRSNFFLITINKILIIQSKT